MRCISCDFDLAHTAAGRCPECGRAFDAADPTTYIGERNTRFARRLAAAPGWPMAAGAALVAVLVLRVNFSPGQAFSHSLTALLVGGLFGLTYLARLVIALIGHLALPRQRPRLVPIAPWRWLLAPGIIGLALLVNGAGITRHAAFLLDSRALEPVATGPAVQPSAWMRVPAWSASVARGAVWDNIAVDAFDPATRLGQLAGPFEYAKDGSDERWNAYNRYRSRDPSAIEPIPGITRIRLARLAVFLAEGHGYASFSAPAWAYAPGAPDTFFLDDQFAFHRYSGDWFVSRGWIRTLEDQPAAQKAPDAAPSPLQPASP